MASTGEGEETSAMVPPKKRGAAAAASGEGDPKRAKGASGRAARAANRAHEDEHPQADAAQHALEAVLEQDAGKGKRARKPTAKQAAAAEEALEQAAVQEAAEPAAEEQEPQQEVAADEDGSLPVGAAAAEEAQQVLPAGLELPAEQQQPQPQQQQQEDPHPQQHQQEAVADATAVAQAPYPMEAVQQQHQAGGPAADPAAAVAASTHMQAPDAAQHAAAQQGLQQQYDPAAQQQQQQLVDPAHMQQLYAPQHLDPHAPGGMQADAAGAGDLQALFDTSALVLGITLVAPDPQTGEDAMYPPVSVPVPPTATVAELRQRIAHTNMNGQMFPAEHQELTLVTAEGAQHILRDYDENGQAIALHRYEITAGGAQRHALYLRIHAAHGHEMVAAAAQGDPHQQQLAGAEPPDLNPDGSEKKKRRQHTRWKEEEVMRLLEGVECLGVGHWRQMQRDYQLEHRTDVDLKDKWRNITKAIGQNKKMRGFNMAADLVLRVQNCMRVAAEKKMAKQANEGGHAPGMEHATLEQQQQQGMPQDAQAAAQAAAEGAAVQGVLDGALPQQVAPSQGDSHVDIMDPSAGHYQQQLQGMEPQEQQQQQQQQEHDPAAALPTQHDPSAQHDPNLQHDPSIQQDPHAQQDHGAMAAAQEQQHEPQQQQQYHDGGHEHDPGAVVLPVPQFDDMGGSPGVGDAPPGASPPASGALPSAPPLELE